MAKRQAHWAEKDAAKIGLQRERVAVVKDIDEFLVAETPESAALRRCSPFCGILTPTEIASVWQRWD